MKRSYRPKRLYIYIYIYNIHIYIYDIYIYIYIYKLKANSFHVKVLDDPKRYKNTKFTKVILTISYAISKGHRNMRER